MNKDDQDISLPYLRALEISRERVRRLYAAFDMKLTVSNGEQIFLEDPVTGELEPYKSVTVDDDQP